MDEQLFQQKLRSTLLPAWEQLPDFGLYMDQVMTYAEKCFAGVAEAEQKLMTPAMMNNYVKGGLVDRPVGKKYSRDSLAQLLMLCLLKSTTSMDTLKTLLHPADSTTQELYASFRQAQERIAASFTAPPDPTCLCAGIQQLSICLQAPASGAQGGRKGRVTWSA